MNSTLIKTKKITCLQCNTKKQGDDSSIKDHENCWWLCDTCENELEEKLSCYNNDVNYNLNRF